MAVAMIVCSFPPSVNAIWKARRARKGGKPAFYLDPAYRAWKGGFDGLLMTMRPRPKVKGRFVALITLDETRRRSNMDADNRGKVLLDACQRCGVIENDSLADRVTIQWGKAPEGARILIMSAAA